jgi:hypothetical protein
MRSFACSVLFSHLRAGPSASARYQNHARYGVTSPYLVGEISATSGGGHPHALALGDYAPRAGPRLRVSFGEVSPEPSA